MRCEECGRVLKNAHMWQLGGDINAPTSRSMRRALLGMPRARLGPED